MPKTLRGGPVSNEPTPSETRAAEAALAREMDGQDEPATVDPHDDRTKGFTHVGFARMRTDWHGSDGQMMASITNQAESALLVAFPDAYMVLNAIYDEVREPLTDDDGVILTDDHGFTRWARNEYGGYIEDYTRLGIRQREEFLFRITTRLVEWEQGAADMWGEAMFAKAIWEERFTVGFFQSGGEVGTDVDSGSRKTDETMTQRGRLASRDERYFALYRSMLSRKAEALVRSLERVSLRLSQSLGK